MGLNPRYQFILLHPVGWDRISAAAEDINQAIVDGGYRIGEAAGLPLHHFSLEDVAAAPPTPTSTWPPGAWTSVWWPLRPGPHRRQGRCGPRRVLLFEGDDAVHAHEGVWHPAHRGVGPEAQHHVVTRRQLVVEGRRVARADDAALETDVEVDRGRAGRTVLGGLEPLLEVVVGVALLELGQIDEVVLRGAVLERQQTLARDRGRVGRPRCRLASLERDGLRHHVARLGAGPRDLEELPG